MGDFADKVILITGAGRGLGRELALAFASLDASVAANDLNPLSLDQTIAQVQQAGGKARPFVFDVAKRMPVEGMLAQVLDQLGHIDILVNHAAVHPDASLLDMDEWDFHRTLDVNLAGPFFTMQQVGRVMRQQGGGSIVNLLTSPGLRQFTKGHTALSASQAGLLGMTSSAAAELAPYHIRVNTVCLGRVFTAGLPPAFVDKTSIDSWSDAQPRLWLGDHPEVDRLVLYLCSEQASALTGQIFGISSDT